MIDLTIAGGGPAGLATAIFAAMAGMSVVVVEPRSGPIDKACGEGIMPAGRAYMDKLEIGPIPGRSFTGVRYHRNGASATGKFRTGTGIGIRRIDLSESLWRRAESLGVERVQGRVRQVECRNAYVVVDGQPSRWLVGADGLHSTVRQSLGIPLLRGRQDRFGARRHFLIKDPTELVEVYLGDSEEAYVTPVGDNQVGVAILSAHPPRFDEDLARFPSLKDRLGDPLDAVRGAGPFRRFAATVASGHVAFVGDAAGFLDPITGEGIRLGFESAEFVVDCMTKNRLDRYQAGWRRILRKYRLITSSLLALRRNSLTRDAIVPTLKIAPFVFDGMLDLLGGL